MSVSGSPSHVLQCTPPVYAVDERRDCQPREQTPKRRCFAHMWAGLLVRSSASAYDPSLGLSYAAFVGTECLLSPLDREFDNYFEIPDGLDTVAKWKCPVPFHVYQQRAIRFTSFKPSSSEALSTARQHENAMHARVSDVTGGLSVSGRPTQTNVTCGHSPVSKSKRNNAAQWSLRQCKPQD